MDIIESVKAAEELAENIKQSAKAEAQKLLAESEKKATDDAQKMIADAKATGEGLFSEAMARADLATEKAKITLEKEIEAVKATAQKNKGEAVNKIISLV